VPEKQEESRDEELYVFIYFYVLPLQTRRALFADPMGTVHVCEIFAQ
jgi:hypothetical protein